MKCLHVSTRIKKNLHIDIILSFVIKKGSNNDLPFSGQISSSDKFVDQALESYNTTCTKRLINDSSQPNGFLPSDQNVTEESILEDTKKEEVSISKTSLSEALASSIESDDDDSDLNKYYTGQIMTDSFQNC